MEGYDEQILEAQREMERRNYTTLETGIYVDDSQIGRASCREKCRY